MKTKAPDTLTKEHVIEAIEHLKAGRVTRWGPSRKYDLLYKGRSYPPKAVLGWRFPRVCASMKTPLILMEVSPQMES
jgi:hypothetical protein